MHPDSWRYRGCLFSLHLTLYQWMLRLASNYQEQCEIKSTSRTRRDIRRFKRPKNANHTHMYTTHYKAASSAPSPRKQAATRKRAGSKATNPQTLFQALCLRVPLARERVKSPPLFGIILPLNFSRAAVWVCADTYPGMTLCESLPYDMVDTTIVGCLTHPFHPAHD